MDGLLLNYYLSTDLSAYGGNYRIKGVITENNIPGIYKVFLFDRRSLLCIRGCFSNAQGQYSFDNIKYSFQGFFVIGQDNAGNPLNAAIADFVTPEAMP